MEWATNSATDRRASSRLSGTSMRMHSCDVKSLD